MNCKKCDKPLTGRQKLYCSNECRLAYTKEHGRIELPMITCETCGKVYRRHRNKGGDRFCSVECYKQDRVDHPERYSTSQDVEVECEHCGKTFMKKRNQYVKTPRHFCSRNCANQSRSELLKKTKEKKENWGVPVVCQGCGETFHVKPYQVDKRKYCSRQCVFSARYGVYTPRNKDISGAKNPNYKNNGNRKNAKDVYQRHFESKCMICGWDTFVDIHHITPVRKGGKNELTNLIALCPNHHRMADMGMISPDELRTIILDAIVQLPDHLRPSGLQLSDPPQNDERQSLFSESELAKKSD